VRGATALRCKTPTLRGNTATCQLFLLPRPCAAVLLSVQEKKTRKVGDFVGRSMIDFAAWRRFSSNQPRVSRFLVRRTICTLTDWRVEGRRGRTTFGCAAFTMMRMLATFAPAHPHWPRRSKRAPCSLHLMRCGQPVSGRRPVAGLSRASPAALTRALSAPGPHSPRLSPSSCFTSHTGTV